MSIEYSAAIRSVRDTAFLHWALHALQQPSVLPREILIVIPYDAVLWETGCFLVRSIQVAQGMVTQHAEGIIASQSAQLILMDHDIFLDRSAYEVLLCAVRTNNADIVLPYWREGWLRCKLARLFFTFWGMALPLYVGGIKYTAGGVFYYPLSEPGAKESWTTLVRDGRAIALDRTLASQQACLGDPELQDITIYALRQDGALVSALARQGARAIIVSGAQFEYLSGTTLLDPKKFYVRFKPQVYIHYLSWVRCIKLDYERTLFGKFYAYRMCSWYVLGVFFLAGIISLKHRTFQALCGACDAVYVCSWRDVLSASKEGA